MNGFEELKKRVNGFKTYGVDKSIAVMMDDLLAALQSREATLDEQALGITIDHCDALEADDVKSVVFTYLSYLQPREAVPCDDEMVEVVADAIFKEQGEKLDLPVWRNFFKRQAKAAITAINERMKK